MRLSYPPRKMTMRSYVRWSFTPAVRRHRWQPSSREEGVSHMMRRHPDREFAFRVRFRMTRGVLKLGEREVGGVTGQVVVPIQAVYRAHPSPGQYIFSPAERGRLVPMSGQSEDVPKEVLVATMGYLDVDVLVGELDLPASRSVIPGELLSELTLDADLEYEDVDADEEYKANEPADLEEARQRYDGRWHLVIDFPLGESIPRGEPRLSLDRWEFELDARYAQLEELN